MSKTHPHNQAVAAALRSAYGQKRDSGGTVDGPIQPGQIPNSDQEKQAKQQGYLMGYASRDDGGELADGGTGDGISGPITGTSDGRADAIATTVPDGSHILTSDFVNSLGDGNSEAGMAKLKKMFPNSEKGSGGGGIKASPMAKPSPAMKLSAPKVGAMPKIPSIAKSGMSAKPHILKAPGAMPHLPHMAGMPKGLASGGAAKGVPCKLSAGEFAVHPLDVASVAGGGDLETGHRALDAWMMMRRHKQIQKLKSLPPPVGS